MIFVDSNIPMYLVGADHPCKRVALKILEQLTEEGQKLVTNTEVFQEILHRYTSIQKKGLIQETFDSCYEFIDQIFPVLEEDILGAKDLLLAYEGLSARDAIHASHMKRLKIKTLFSFDTGFDKLPFLQRIPEN